MLSRSPETQDSSLMRAQTVLKKPVMVESQLDKSEANDALKLNSPFSVAGFHHAQSTVNKK